MAKKELKKRKDSAGGKRVLVWHVFHWKERYAVDPRDWPAERGLLFVRQVVVPVDTESTHYFGQLRDLEILAGDWRQYHIWKSLWEDLRAMTATQSRIHQGYLLDEHQQPLKEVQIAARLHTDPEETRRVLKALCAANLMERVPLPLFGEIKRAQAKENEDHGRDKALCGAQTRVRKRSCAQDAASVANAPVVAAEENGPGAVEISDLGRPVGAVVGAECARQRAGPFIKGNGSNGNGNPNQNEETANGSAEGQGQAEPEATQAEGASRADQPIKPKGAEAEGPVDHPVRHTGSNAPPPSLDGCTSTMGSAVTQVIRRLSGQAQAFAEWVYDKLGLPDPPNSEEWRCQVAAIGGIWVFAETQLPPTWLDEYRTWAYQRAEYLRDNRAAYRSHVCKWMSDAKYEVRNRKRKAGRAR